MSIFSTQTLFPFFKIVIKDSQILISTPFHFWKVLPGNGSKPSKCLEPFQMFSVSKPARFYNEENFSSIVAPLTSKQVYLGADTAIASVSQKNLESQPKWSKQENETNVGQTRAKMEPWHGTKKLSWSLKYLTLNGSLWGPRFVSWWGKNFE